MDWLKQALPEAIGGLIVVLIVSFVGWLWRRSRQVLRFSDRKVLITKPRHNDKVLRKIVCEGTYPKHLENADFWIVVVPFNLPNYHPQPGPVAKSKNGKWQGISYIGSSDQQNIVETFTINIIQTTPEATEAFQKYLQDGAITKQWYGLDALPQGCTMQDSVTVIRK